MKILITGINGFVGTNLVEALKESAVIYGLDITKVEREGVADSFLWSEIDRLPPFDAVIHLAGKAHDVKKRAHAEEYFDINTGLTQKIFDLFLASPAKKFIFFSSVKAAADRVPGEILTEEVEPSPVGPYGESKIAAENYILRLLEEDPGKAAQKQVYILRPCMIHGPGNKGNLNLLYSVVKRGIPWPLGAFGNRRSFTSIDNLSYIIKGLMEQDVPSGIYNVGDDTALSTVELVSAICSTLGRKSRVWRVPAGLVRTVARIGDRLPLPLDTERLNKLTENYVVSNQKIKDALGIERLPVTATDGIRKTILSFKYPKA